VKYIREESRFVRAAQSLKRICFERLKILEVDGSEPSGNYFRRSA